jgi:hypothetical protein
VISVAVIAADKTASFEVNDLFSVSKNSFLRLELAEHFRG